LEALKPYPAGPLPRAVCVCAQDTEENRVTSPVTAITVIMVGIVNCFFFFIEANEVLGGACVMSSRGWWWRQAGQVEGRIKAVKERHWRRD